MGRKWRKRREIILIIPALVTLICSHLFTKPLKAQSTNIDAQVRIPVCGDGVAEYPEECDGTDLNNQTCRTFGYSKGTLSCTSGCLVDTSQCLLVQSTSDNDSDDGDDDSDSSSSDSESSTSDTTTTTIQSLERITVTKILRLPAKIAKFDINNDNRIDLTEINAALEKWVNSWRTDKIKRDKDCDVNEDEVCNVVDFSILLYHINK